MMLKVTSWLTQMCRTYQTWHKEVGTQVHTERILCVCVFLKTPILVKKKLVYLTKAVGKTIFFQFFKKTLQREFTPGPQKSSKGPLKPLV